MHLWQTSKRRNPALAALLVLAIATASGCAAGTSPHSQGSARVAVARRALTSNVAQVTVTISKGAGPDFTPIVENLVQSGTDWSGYITGIPAGQGRQFDVVASDSTGTQLYTGSATADIAAGSVASVVITLSTGSGTGSEFQNQAPVIDYLSASATLVPPGGVVRVGSSAHDPDPTGTVTYKWAATCGTFDNPTAAAANWTAPPTTGNCQLSVNVGDNSGASVTAYLVIDVGVTTGDVLVSVTGSTTPAPVIMGVAAKVTYGTTVQGDLSVSATSLGGTSLTYAWSSDCTHLSFTTTSPYSPSAPHFNSTDTTKACVITVTVSDNSGAHTVGVVTVPPEPIFNLAPVITNTVQPSVDVNDPLRAEIVNPGDAVLLGVQAYDPEKKKVAFAWTATAGTLDGQVDQVTSPGRSAIVFHAPSQITGPIQVTVRVSDPLGEYTAHIFNFKGSAVVNPCSGLADGSACSTGNKCVTGETCTGGTCGAGKATVCTAADQCHAAGACDASTGTCSNPTSTDGTPCNDGNACTRTDVCAAGVCIGSAVTCAASDQCHAAGVCDPATGSCSNPVAPNGTACNDGNACTQTDSCQAGVCTGTNPVVCTGTATCNPGTGLCAGGQAPAALAGVLSPSALTVNAGQIFTATLSVSNSGGTPANGVSAAAIAACTGTPAAAAVPAGATVPFTFTGCSSNTVGTLSLSTSASGTDANTSATVSTGAVNATVTVNGAQATGPTLQFAKDVQLANFQGVAVATDGSAYVTGALILPTKVFDGTSLTSAGAGDAFVGKYSSSTGNAVWVKNYGDAADQEPTALTVTSDGTVASIGQFLGSLTATLGNSLPTPIDYLLAVNATDGSVKWARSFNDGVSGVLYAVAANQTLNEIAVCGVASQAATDLVPGAAYGGASDIVIAMFDSTGALKWSKQIGGANDEQCDTLAVDDVGDVYAAGWYNGALSITGTALPNPGSSFRHWLWVAKFNGTTGAAVSQASFGSGAGNHKPQQIAVDSSDKVILSGYMSNTLAFGGTASSLTSAGGTDAFVAKLDPVAATPFAGIWAVRIGGTGPDEARGVGVDSTGNVITVGLFNGTTTGAAALVDPNAGGSAAFLLKLDGTSGSTVFSAAYGNATNTVNANHVAINRHGTGALLDEIVFGGEFGGTLSFGSLPSITAATADDFLVFAK